MRRDLTLSGIGLGIFLIVLGLAFFSDSNSNTSYFTAVFRYYPLLSIFLGLDFILNGIEKTASRIKRPEGWIASIIIIITICGLTFTAVPRMLGNNWKDIADFDLSRISMGPWTLVSEKTLKQDYQLPAGISTLRLENEFGDLEVRPGNGNTVTAIVELKIYGHRRRETADVLPDVQLSGEASGERFLVKLVKPDLPEGRVQANITIIVPPDIGVELKNSFGKINVVKIQGNLKVDSSNGRITIDQVTGDAVVNNQFAEVAIGTVDGNLDINVNSGRIKIAKVGKNLTAHNNFGRLEAGSILGDFQANCKNSRIEVSKVLGKTKVENAFGGVTLKDCQGSVEAELSNGNLKVGITKIAPSASYNFDIQFGNVEISLPADAKFNLDAASSFGNIRSGFPIQLTTTAGNNESFSGGINGGGPPFRVRTKNGNITIE